jgi:hypothetical protein
MTFVFIVVTASSNQALASQAGILYRLVVRRSAPRGLTNERSAPTLGEHAPSAS